MTCKPYYTMTRIIARKAGSIVSVHKGGGQQSVSGTEIRRVLLLRQGRGRVLVAWHNAAPKLEQGSPRSLTPCCTVHSDAPCRAPWRYAVRRHRRLNRAHALSQGKGRANVPQTYRHTGTDKQQARLLSSAPHQLHDEAEPQEPQPQPRPQSQKRQGGWMRQRPPGRPAGAKRTADVSLCRGRAAHGTAARRTGSYRQNGEARE